MNFLLRTLVLGGLVAIGSWWTLHFREQSLERHRRIAELTELVENRDQRILELDETVKEREREIRELELAMWLLKVDHRVGRIVVLEQTVTPGDPEEVQTRLRFEELGPDGLPLGPGRELVVEGRVVYIEGLVIKFDDEYVEGADELRGTSVCMFRRLFGENQKPSEGVELDSKLTRPLAYGAEEGPDPYYADLWGRFWEYANDPELAAEKGVRAIHGEAPFMEMGPGKVYRVELRASGGLSVRSE